MMTLRLQQSLAIITLLLIPSFVIGEEYGAKSFPLPDHGKIQLNVPKSWRSKILQPKNNLPPTIAFLSKTGSSFQVLLTPLWPNSEKASPGQRNIKENIEQIIEQVKPISIEKEIPIKELKGTSGAGYYFSMTDKAPKPGEFIHMTQGMYQLGELLITFTAFWNDGAGNVSDETIRILESATHIQNPSSLSNNDVDQVRKDAIQISQRGNNFVLTVPVSQLTMSIPRLGLIQKDNPARGSTDNPRYFYFKDPNTGLLISGWFEQGKGYSGVQNFWKDEIGSWKEKGLPEAQNVSITKIGNWDVVLYDMKIFKGVDGHIRAHWLQAGTWIDVHLSIHTNQSSQNTRNILISFLKKIAIKEKG
jgi:hypothetical protein